MFVFCLKATWKKKKILTTFANKGFFFSNKKKIIKQILDTRFTCVDIDKKLFS